MPVSSFVPSWFRHNLHHDTDNAIAEPLVVDFLTRMKLFLWLRFLAPSPSNNPDSMVIQASPETLRLSWGSRYTHPRSGLSGNLFHFRCLKLMNLKTDLSPAINWRSWLSPETSGESLKIWPIARWWAGRSFNLITGKIKHSWKAWDYSPPLPP